MDSRQGLKVGMKLSLYRGCEERRETFVIKREVGRGGSCIVYDAAYQDSEGMDHFTRLKECYPYQLKLVRNGDGALCASSEDEEAFQKEKEKFIKAYKIHTKMRIFAGLINTAANITDLYSGNNTLYSSMDYEEGKVYSEIKEETLQECLRRVKATARTLEKYHGAGYLHLDIKPENIWIFPETTEQIRLFDFDSIVKKEDLKKAQGMHFPCTKGFAAPELERGQPDRIGEATDVYGIGALLFFRLMGRCPERQEREFFAVFDFSRLKEKNPLCQPAFFKKLNEFFSKTLKAASSGRFASMKEAADFLEDMIPLADPDAVCPISNFSYHQDNFIGRQDEKAEIRDRLSQKHVFVLYGIGGIGKTELALAYAYENQNEYGYILFLRYEGSLIESLCRDDIKLYNFSREEEETDRDYYRRKIDALKLALSGQDLLILDNFDTESEKEWEELENILEIPCHILVTSRYNPKDYNYPCMEVEEFKDQRELMELFRAYNSINYDEKEQKAVEEIIELEDRHTMAVELTAKNLRVSKTPPSMLLERLKQRQGIVNMEDDPVGHRKDRKVRKLSVQEHLEILFDLSSLTDGECYILDNLSLFSGIQVQTGQFLAWCPDCSGKHLGNLVQKGWVENRGEGNKISLHQVILDLIYHIRKPDGESCKTLTAAMTRYMDEEIRDWTHRKIRSTVLDIFGSRIWTEAQDKKDFPYTAAFYLKYCKRSYKEEWADFCLREYEKYPGQCQNEVAEVYDMRAYEKLEQLDEWEVYQNVDLQRKVFLEMVNNFHCAIEYKRKFFDGRRELVGDFMFQIGERCKEKASGIFIVEDEIEVQIFDFIAECMEKGVQEYEKGDYDKRRLISMYKKLIEFYHPDEVIAQKPEKYCNLDKSVYFYSLMEKVRDSEGEEKDEEVELWMFDFGTVSSYISAGDFAMENEEYESALQYFNMALEKGEHSSSYSVRGAIVRIYEKMGDTKKALEYYKTYENEIDYSDFDLGRLYRKIGQYEKAAKCFEKGFALCEQNIAKGSDVWKEDKLKGYMEASGLPGRQGRDARRKGMEYYRKEDYFQEADEIDLSLIYMKWLLLEESYEELCDFLQKLYARNKGLLVKDTVQELKGILQKLMEHTEKSFAKSHMLFLLAMLEEELYPADKQAEEQYCLDAIELLEKEGQENSGLAMEIRDRLAHIYRDMNQEEKAEQYTKACDYEILAMEKEKRILEEKRKSEEKEERCMEAWIDAGDEYDDMDNPQKAIRCYKRARKRWEKLGREKKQGNLYRHKRLMDRLISNERKNQNSEAGIEILDQWYSEVLDLCRDCRKKSYALCSSLEKIENYFGEFGNKSLKLRCRFQRGLLEIGVSGQEMLRLETVKELAGYFFNKISEEEAAQQIDEVLGVCDDVLNIGLGEEGEEIETACRNVISALREGEISFKRL